MVKENVIIKRINDTPADFMGLFEIWNRIKGDSRHVHFDFSECDFLRPNAVAFIGGMARQIEARNGSVVFDWDTIQHPSVENVICKNGFASTFGHPEHGTGHNVIPYREDRLLNMNSIMDYLTDNWLGRGWVNVSNRVQNAIAGKMWEIYNNAFEHSGTKIGVFSCGQNFVNKKELILSVVDFGQGIPNVVRGFLSKYVDKTKVQMLTGAQCLKWAFKKRNSTCPGDVIRGVGLDLLKEFITLNNGKLEIYSNEGYVIIDKGGERFENRSVSFEGTVVHITLRCDQDYISFKDENVQPF